MPVMAGPFQASDFQKLIPADKKLSKEWIASLFARGTRTVYRGAELDKIGMPIGGICTGQVYLGGDGKLWHWDIFNSHIATGDAHYAHPPQPDYPLEQGFAIGVRAGGKTTVRSLARSGFSQISFTGEYPIGFVEYRDPQSPVSVALEAFSPFIPLDPHDSHLPATILRYTVKNDANEKVECELAGWLENAVCPVCEQTFDGSRSNRIVRGRDFVLLSCTATSAPAAEQPKRPTIVFTDFEGKDFGPWKMEGEAFGKTPAHGARSDAQHLSGFEGKGLANSWTGSDAPKGKLISPPFTIERTYISFLIGGGDHPGETCINLLVDGEVVRTQTGTNSDAMQWADWNVHRLQGKTAHIEIVDNHSGGWGHIDIDQIEFGDRPRAAAVMGSLEEQADFGSMSLALLDAQAGDWGCAAVARGTVPTNLRSMPFAADKTCPWENAASAAKMGLSPSAQEAKGDRHIFRPSGVYEGSSNTGRKMSLSPAATYSQPFPERPMGAVSRSVSLEPGGQATVTFVVAWCFPNILHLGLKGVQGRQYGKRFASAQAVVEHIAANYARLSQQTHLWHDTWYDSTLPYWFLDRTLLNISTLATSTAYWLGNGRFYGWEGVGCCQGTCQHVWHYAQAVGRLFPSLERATREMVDYGLAFHDDTGAMDFRAEFDQSVAVDGQSGTILRAYREHQMSADGAFLRRIWPRVRKSLEYLMAQDPNENGILGGPQMNTLDTPWFGKIAWLSSLYGAALRAGAQMALEMGDGEFARRASSLADGGGRSIDRLLFNGEYFIQVPDPAHRDAVGSYNACEIDQVFGQSWAFQVGLDRVLPREPTLSALRSLWKYNFTPDVGGFRKANRPGRWFAMAGEGGLIMATWPRGDQARVKKGFDFYFNECMNGFEYQVAGHMIWEGMVQEGLAIARAVHDRYHASRRNPWNEVECGDHYARSMASYGVFLAACGYQYHGPKGHLAFAPRLTPEDFRCAFAAAEGWGQFLQRREAGEQTESIEVRWGRLRLASLEFELPEQAILGAVTVRLGGQTLAAQVTASGLRAHIALTQPVVIRPGTLLEIRLALRANA